MAKKFKKMLSILLTISMCMSMVSISAFADGETDEGSGSGEPVTTVTVTFDSEGNSTTTSTTTNQWSDTDTSGSTTTTVIGQETSSESIIETADGHLAGKKTSLSGSETTEITDVTIESETQKDVVIGEDTIVDDPVETGKTDGTPEETNDTSENDGWIEGTPTDDGTWTQNDEKSNLDNEFVSQGKTPIEGDSTDVDVDEPSGEIRLDLTPTAPGNKDEEKVYFGIEDTDFDMSRIPRETTNEPYTDPETGKTGSKTVTVTESKDAYGNIIGYDVTTTITYDTQPTSQETGELKETGRESSPVSTRTEPEIPADWNKDETVEKDADGNVTKEVTMTRNPIYDGDQIIGYTITKTTTDYSRSTDTAESSAETTSTSSVPVETFSLPEKPESGISTDADGNTVTTTVEEIIEGGRPVGYKSITVTTDANGRELSRSSSDVFGTTTKVSSTTVTDPAKEVSDITVKTQKVETTTIYGTTYTKDVELEQDRTTVYEADQVITTENYQLVEIDGQMYHFYTGEMGTVTDNGSTGTTKLHIQANQTQYSGTNHTTVDDDIQSTYDATNGSWDYYPEADTQAERDALRAQLKDGEFVLVGRGLISEYNLNDDQGGAHVPRQYAIMDKNGNIIYGYCVELGKSLKVADTTNGTYTEKEIFNYETFYNTTDKAAKLAIITHNGFWGTYEENADKTEKPVTGSLAYVKDLIDENRDLLKAKGYSDADIDSVISSLTAGQAMTGTQASIWKYGTKTSTTLDNINGLMQYYADLGANDTDMAYYDATSQDYKNVNALYQVLTGMADNGLGAAPETITGDDLTNATIILDGKAKDNDGNVKTVNVDGKDHEQYNTDIAFTLAIAPSSINGDLVVNVYGNGDNSKPIATRRLAGDDSLTNFGKITPDANGTYTIEDLEIAEGVVITLNLEGTQHLANGVYVYECADSQNFIGLTSVDHAVDLSVDLKFSVDEPDASVEHSGSTEEFNKTDTKVETRKESRRDSKKTTTRDTDSVTTEQITTETKVYADITITEVTTKSAVSAREWSEASAEYIPVPHDGGGGDPDPDPEKTEDSIEEPTDIPEEPVPHDGDGYGGGSLEELPEDPIPLADIPKTGDNAMVWYMMTLLSGLALAIMTLAGKRREN